MTRVVETDEKGAILAPEQLGLRPKSRYVAEVEGEQVVLKFVESTPEGPASRDQKTPQQRAEEFLQWANRPRPPAPRQPTDEELRRKNYYAEWRDLTPEQRLEKFDRWIAQQEPSEVHLTNEQLRRENMYD